jgi:hypothetical protein
MGPAGFSWPAHFFYLKGDAMKRGRPKGTTKGGLKYLDEGQLKAFLQAIRKTKDAGRKTRDDLIFVFRQGKIPGKIV